MFKGLRPPWRKRAEVDLSQGIFDLHNHLAQRALALAESGALGLADGFDLRFEVMVLLVSAALHHLGTRQGRQGAALARLWELTFEGFDFSLRQRGVMDVRMGKRMQKLFQHATGRRNAYLDALDQGDETALAAAVARNVLDGAPATDPRVGMVLAELPEVAARVTTFFSLLEKGGGNQ